MKIVMEIGNNLYMGWNQDRMFMKAVRSKAIEFEHGEDIFRFINCNRKKINAFLKRNALHMKLKIEADSLKSAS